MVFRLSEGQAGHWMYVTVRPVEPRYQVDARLAGGTNP